MPKSAILAVAFAVAGAATAQAQDAGDPSKGAAFAKRCVACHSLEKDGPNKVGPHLWGVVNRPIASVADFKYSDAMLKFSEAGAKRWTIAELGAYLLDPKKHVPGNKMAFPGVKKDADRANVIAYLQTLSDTPPTQ